MRVLELLETADKTEKDPNDLTTIQSNVYGSESGYGKADTTKPNYAGAIGPMQILPGTFNWMQKSGIIPKDYDINNPEQNKAAGDALLAHYHQKYNGDPAKVYAAYYGGPGAVNKDGSINTHWRDLKNPKAPTVGQYIEKAMARSGAGDYIASVGNTVSNTLSDIKSSIGSAYDKLASTFTSPEANDSGQEIEIIINGKKKKFRNMKDAQIAIELAKKAGEEVSFG